MGFLISILTTVFYCFAEERITLTTYYPAPYGVYKDLRADQMAIGSEYRYVQSLTNGTLIVSEKVGIGTADPGPYKLYIAGGNTGASPTPRIKFNDYFDNSGNPSVSHIDLYGGQYGFGISAGNLDIFTNGNIRFYKGADEYMVIEDGGNVGIGTNDPAAKLHVNGVIKASGTIYAGGLEDGNQVCRKDGTNCRPIAYSSQYTLHDHHGGPEYITMTSTSTSVCFLTKEIINCHGGCGSNGCEIEVHNNNWRLKADSSQSGTDDEVWCGARCLIWGSQ